MAYSEHTYYVTLKKGRRGYEILYNIGNESRMTTVLRLGGRNAGKIFRDTVEALAVQGAAVPLRISDHEQVYGIREDLGPVVGAYLILVRRARNAEKWSRFFRALLEGRYAGIPKALTAFLELAIELSTAMPGGKRYKGYTISPAVADALSSSLKRFVDKIIKST